MDSPKIAHGMDAVLYHAHDAISASDLKNLRRSPAAAHHPQDYQTKSMSFGTAIHTAILEPKALFERYALEPEEPEDFEGKKWKATKAYKEQKAALEGAGKAILTTEEWDAIPAVVDNLNDAGFMDLIPLDPKDVEVSIFAPDPDLPTGRKIRPDAIHFEKKTIVDVKTTRDHRPGPFQRQVASLGYHLSAAYYLDTAQMAGIDVENYVFLTIANTYPFECAAYTLDFDSMEQGRADYKALVAEWAKREKTGDWPAYRDGIEEIRIPRYAMTILEDAW